MAFLGAKKEIITVARAKKHYIPGQIWHITHRCHQRVFYPRSSGKDTTLEKQFDLITFDVYSALFDIETSLLPFLEPNLPPHIDTLAFFRLWRSKQLQGSLIVNSINTAFVPFRTLTRLALNYCLSRHKITLSENSCTQLVDAWDHLTPWPEANHVLSELKNRGYRLAFLSNGDRDMLQALTAKILPKMDHVFSCEEAGAYKPDASVYQLPLSALGLKKEQILHVAGGANDVLGAKIFGIPCAWSNRHSDFVIDPAYNADYEFPDLIGLLDIL